MYSVQISWTNPSVTLQEVEEVVSPILGEDYDGIVVEDLYLYIRSNSPISVENEYSIKDKIYLLNNQPQSVSVISQPPTVIAAVPPFGNNAVYVNGVVKYLYTHHVGVQVALTQGVNVIRHVASCGKLKLTGVEVIGGESLDFADLKILDCEDGMVTGIPYYVLNQFGFSVNIAKDFYKRDSPFDATLYCGMVIEITYTSVSAKTIGINFLKHEVKDSP